MELICWSKFGRAHDKPLLKKDSTPSRGVCQRVIILKNGRLGLPVKGWITQGYWWASKVGFCVSRTQTLESWDYIQPKKNTSGAGLIKVSFICYYTWCRAYINSDAKSCQMTTGSKRQIDTDLFLKWHPRWRSGPRSQWHSQHSLYLWVYQRDHMLDAQSYVRGILELPRTTLRGNKCIVTSPPIFNIWCPSSVSRTVATLTLAWKSTNVAWPESLSGPS